MRYLKYVFFSFCLHDAIKIGYKENEPLLYRFFRMKMNKYKRNAR